MAVVGQDLVEIPRPLGIAQPLDLRGPNGEVGTSTTVFCFSSDFVTLNSPR